MFRNCERRRAGPVPSCSCCRDAGAPTGPRATTQAARRFRSRSRVRTTVRRLPPVVVANEFRSPTGHPPSSSASRPRWMRAGSCPSGIRKPRPSRSARSDVHLHCPTARGRNARIGVSCGAFGSLPSGPSVGAVGQDHGDIVVHVRLRRQSTLRVKSPYSFCENRCFAPFDSLRAS